MKSFLEKARKVLSHNQFLAVAIVIVLCLSVYLVGCDSKTTNPFNKEGAKVTREQLNNEIDKFAADVELAYADLDKQDIFKQKLFEIGLVAAQGGTVDPIGAGVTLLGILGIGAVADNRKKDSIIKTLKKSQANTGEKTTA
jgi:hypothetical protein